MAKYYVQSGTMKLVVQADDPRKAALWAVHKAMRQVLPIADEAPLSPERKQRRARERGCHVLGETMELSEIGFHHSEVFTFETLDVLTEWNQLLVALDRLEKALQQPHPDLGMATAV